MQHVLAAWIDAETAKGYTAGLIILAAAPWTATVFVRSYLQPSRRKSNGLSISIRLPRDAKIPYRIIDTSILPSASWHHTHKAPEVPTITPMRNRISSRLVRSRSAIILRSFPDGVGTGSGWVCHSPI